MVNNKKKSRQESNRLYLLKKLVKSFNADCKAKAIQNNTRKTLSDAEWKVKVFLEPGESVTILEESKAYTITLEKYPYDKLTIRKASTVFDEQLMNP